jgi:hypothetical protein
MEEILTFNNYRYFQLYFNYIMIVMFIGEWISRENLRPDESHKFIAECQSN